MGISFEEKGHRIIERRQGIRCNRHKFALKYWLEGAWKSIVLL